MRFRSTVFAFGIALAAYNSTCHAQVTVSAALAYTELEDATRWGAAGALYIPIANNTFDIVPNFDYYNAKWSVGGDGLASDTSDVYAFSLDAHANLPALVERVRPYIGTGIAFAGHSGENAFGINLSTGVIIRVRGWKVFPYGQVTYRVMPEFENTASLDTYFIRSGLRIVL